MLHNNVLTQDNLESVDKYFSWVYDVIKPFTGQRILDIGCARGNITDFVKGRELVIGIDVLEDFVNDYKNRFKNFKNISAFKCNIEKDNAEFLLNKDIDTIICLNVLEHIENDMQALKNMHRILKTGGKLIIQVPAFACLYGTLDAADIHFRRYGKKEIISRITAAGFKIKKVFYFNIAGIIGWFISGKILKDKHFKKDRGILFNSIIPFLRFIEKAIKPPIGLSIFVAAEK